MLIFLIGYRGTGKTAVAQALGLALGWDWVDADVELELRAGLSIAEIFTQSGEAAFRDLEAAELIHLSRRERSVIALGGGVILREENRQQLQAAGQVVWLQASPVTIQQRIEADPTTAARRPNLTAAGGLPEIERLLAVRMPLYQACADLTIDTEAKSPAQIAREIIDALNLA